MDKIEKLKERIKEATVRVTKFGREDDYIKVNLVDRDQILALLDAAGKPVEGEWEAIFDSSTTSWWTVNEGKQEQYECTHGDIAKRLTDLLNSQGAEIKNLKGVHFAVTEYCKRRIGLSTKTTHATEINYHTAKDAQEIYALTSVYRMLSEKPLDSVSLQHCAHWLYGIEYKSLQADLATVKARVAELEETDSGAVNDINILTARVAELEEEKSGDICESCGLDPSDPLDIVTRTDSGHSVCWVCIRTAEVDKINGKLGQLNHDLTSEVGRLREALEFYADKENIDCCGQYQVDIATEGDDSEYILDEGDIARTALTVAPDVREEGGEK